MANVIMISMRNPKLFEEGSEVRARMAEYAALFGELHIVIFSKKEKGFLRTQIAPNAYVYPTESISKFAYVKDAADIGATIIRERGFSGADSVITTQDPFETGMVGRKLSAKFGLPFHVQIHTDLRNPLFKKNILNLVRLTLSKGVLRQAKAVRAVSDRIKSSLAPDAQAKASVLPIFADLEAVATAPIIPSADLRKKYPQFGKIVLAASRLTKEKDVASAIAAFANVAETHPEAGFVIVGEGPEAAALARRADSLLRERGLSGRIVFEPWADRATLFSYMKTCDAFVSSSVYEGYGLSMLEAHAVGATLVATDAGLAPLLAGAICPAGKGAETVSCLASNLAKALSGSLRNKPYAYPYPSKKAYLEAYRKDVERALS